MKKRLFIALNLPEEIKKSISPLILELDKLNRRVTIKWVRADLLHLTLHFLGYLDKNQEEQIIKILPEAAANYRAAKVETGAIGAFPNLISPRVIYLECREVEGDIIGSLQKEIGRVLEKNGYKTDRRLWQAHLTLGRVKGGGKVNLLVKNFPPAKFNITSVELMESQLSSVGPQYKIVKSFRLGLINQ